MVRKNEEDLSNFPASPVRNEWMKKKNAPSNAVSLVLKRKPSHTQHKHVLCAYPGQAASSSKDSSHACLKPRHSRILSRLCVSLPSHDFGTSKHCG